MAVQTAAGSKIYIGPVAASSVDTEGEFSALSYTEIGEVETAGEFGDQVNTILFTALSDRRVRKFKGSFDAGEMTLTVGRSAGDSGQTAVIAALASDSDYAFKVELNDAGTGSPSSPTTFYFRAKVLSYTTNIDNVESIVRSTIRVGINSAIVEVAAV